VTPTKVFLKGEEEIKNNLKIIQFTFGRLNYFVYLCNVIKNKHYDNKRISTETIRPNGRH
jgi:hypothetical protein